MKVCKECFHFKNCDMPVNFLGLMLQYSMEEKATFDGMTLDDFVEYFEQMIDEYVDYMHGHITPQVAQHVKEYLLVEYYYENFIREEVSNV